ncbi:MAG: hypothetical protein DMG76_23845 [Acidobacteria bacterium]|nr:MAG: hypothetical protein DMG76_23845 [Acidobacteriota bacterium]
MISLIHKNAVITVYMDEVDGEFVAAIRLQHESRDRGFGEHFSRIDKAVEFARRKIEEIA